MMMFLRKYLWQYEVRNIVQFQLICNSKYINPLIAKLKPQSNGPSYSNTVIGTLAVDGWAVTVGTARRDWAGPQPT